MIGTTARRGWVVFLAACVALGGSRTARVQSNAPSLLSAHDVVAVREYDSSPMALSPDGRWLAYVVRDFRDAGPPNAAACGYCAGTEVWVTDTTTGQSQNLTKGSRASFGVTWSSRGELAFYSDRDGLLRVWSWRPDGGGLRRISDAETFVFNWWETPAWLPDDSGLIVRTRALAQTERADVAPSSMETASMTPVPNVRVLKSPPEDNATPSARNVPRSDLTIVDAASGRARRIATNIGVGAFKVSPDGRLVAATSRGATPIPNKFLWPWELVVVSVADGQQSVLANGIEHEQPFGSWFSWSPDSRQVAFTDIGSQLYKNVGQSVGELHLVSVRDGARWSTAGIEHPSFGNDRRPPLWNAAGSMMLVIAEGELWAVGRNHQVTKVAALPGKSMLEIVGSGIEGRYRSAFWSESVLAVIRDGSTMSEGIARIHVGTGEVTVLREGAESFGPLPALTTAVASNANVAAYLSEASDRSWDYWISDATFRAQRRITHLNPQFDRSPMGRSRLVEWNGPTGDRLRGVVLLPPEHQEGSRHPVIVDVYGGITTDRALNRFAIGFGMRPEGMSQYLAARGYAVFRPGSVLRMGSPMRDIAQSVISGVDRLIQLGIADPDRLGVIGHSYGGYSALALLVQTNRFRAGVVNQGIADLIGFCVRLNREDNLASGVCEDGQIRLGVTLWEDRKRYIENSPIFFLDKVNAPVLIVNGARDEWASPAAAGALFAGLRRLGKTAEYVSYLDEGHNITLYRDSVDFIGRVERWFDRHLRGVDAAKH